jgi:dephospho-CoA kinase
MILGVSGAVYSGKTTVARILHDAFGYRYVSFGDEVRTERRARNLPENYNLQTLGIDLRNEFGPAYWAQRVLGHISGEVGNRTYVVEGIQTPGDFETLQDARRTL